MTYPGYPNSVQTQDSALCKAVALAPARTSSQPEPTTSLPKAPNGPRERSKARLRQTLRKAGCVFLASRGCRCVDVEHEAAAPHTAHLQPHCSGTWSSTRTSTQQRSGDSALFLTWTKHTLYNGRFYHCLPKAWLVVNSSHISCFETLFQIWARKDCRSQADQYSRSGIHHQRSIIPQS